MMPIVHLVTVGSRADGIVESISNVTEVITGSQKESHIGCRASLMKMGIIKASHSPRTDP